MCTKKRNYEHFNDRFTEEEYFEDLINSYELTIYENDNINQNNWKNWFINIYFSGNIYVNFTFSSNKTITSYTKYIDWIELSPYFLYTLETKLKILSDIENNDFFINTIIPFISKIKQDNLKNYNNKSQNDLIIEKLLKNTVDFERQIQIKNQTIIVLENELEQKEILINKLTNKLNENEINKFVDKLNIDVLS
jgi:hypothetical protein